MGDFIHNNPQCFPVQTYCLYQRMIAGLLLGNTDMHFKNFALFHTKQGYKFTPSYDQVSASLYQYKTVALAIAGSHNLPIGTLNPTHIIRLGEELGLSHAAIHMAVGSLNKNRAAAQQSVADNRLGADSLKKQLIELWDKRWNGTFASIGTTLSQKP